MKIKWFSVVILMFLMGCSAKQNQPDFVIKSQDLHSRINESGAQEFAFIVSASASPLKMLDTSKSISKKELKRFANEERIEDSRALKMQLEDKAAELLKVALEEKSLCPNGYQINDVFWNQRAVQLRGTCE